MKKLLSITVAVALCLALTVPVIADTVNTTATVGGSSAGAPTVVALFMTPDEVDDAATGTDILPEPAVPNSVSPLFPNTDATKDGWKRMNIYVAVMDEASPLTSSIAGVDVTVNYPTTGAPYTGQEKFNLTATKISGAWNATDNYGVQQSYPVVASEGPTGVIAVEPTWTVRELTPATGLDIVDVDANGLTTDPVDDRFSTVLSAWGTKVSYAPGFDASIVGPDFNADKVLVLEMVGYIWCHQDPITYTVCATASNTAQSDPLGNTFTFVPTVSMYLDFSAVDFGDLPSTGINKVIPGDNDLSTAARPTVWDNGNVNAELSVSATALTLGGNTALADPDGISYNSGKIITDFDAKLDYKNADGTIAQQGNVDFSSVAYDDLDDSIPGVGAPTKIVDDTDATEPVLLRACHPAQFDPSIHAASTKVGGSYTGTMTLYISEYSGTLYPKFFTNLP